MKIILGSQSKSRQSLLKSWGYDFIVLNPNINEKAIRSEDPEQLTIALANAKADALLSSIHEPVIVITSDQVVVWNGKIREKPDNENEAREFLHSYASAPAETVTAVVVTNTQTGKRLQGMDRVKIWFNRMPADVIEKFISETDVLSLGGGFSIESPLLKDYVKKIDGELDSIIGLPKTLTEKLMKEVQINYNT